MADHAGFSSTVGRAPKGGALYTFFADYKENNGVLLTLEGVFLNLLGMVFLPLFLVTRLFSNFQHATGDAVGVALFQLAVLTVFLVFGILQFLIILLDRTDNSALRKASIEYQGLGNSLSNAGLSFVIGAGLMAAFLLLLSRVSSASLASLVGSVAPFGLTLAFNDSTVSFLFIKVFSPLLEEATFAGALFPSLVANFRYFQPDLGVIFSLLITAFLFAAFHQAATPFLFVLRIVLTVLMYWRKSIAAPLGAHFALNWMVG